MIIQSAKLNTCDDKHEEVDKKQHTNWEVEPNRFRYSVYDNKKNEYMSNEKRCFEIVLF